MVAVHGTGLNPYREEKMNMTPNLNLMDRAVRRVFGHRAPAVVDALLKTDQLAVLVDELDAEDVARRADLANRLAAVPAKHDARCTEANAKAAAARHALEVAQAAVKQKAESLAQVTSEAVSLSHLREAEQGALERQLLETAPAEIQVFVETCRALMQRARNLEPEMKTETVVSAWGQHKEKAVPDGSKLRAACQALSDAMGLARAMQLKAQTRSEVAASLLALRASLHQPLAAVGLRLPDDGQEAMVVH